ncbi:MAG: hypothetical protein H6807_14630 [Planctomycetes bacterium]|nr:hypothetical protein [Planctomycetota bacterium]
MDIARFKELTRRVLEVTDSLGLHREAVSLPLELDPEGGSVRLAAPGRLEVIGPEEGDLDDFIAVLPDMLSALDLGAVPRAD